MGSMGKVDDPFVVEVADRIHAYVQPDGSWFLNNTGFVVGSDAVVMIDQCGTEDRARAFLRTVQEKTALPVRTLVNTHHHGDHTFGNFVLPPATSIVGHRRCRIEAVATGTAITQLFAGPDWGDLQVRPATITFEDRLTIWADDLELQLIHFGTPAHTTNDVVVWIPEKRVAFSGDLVFHGGTPFALQGSVAGWLEACDLLEALGAETIVPGHGPITDSSAIEPVRAYLTFVQALAAEGREAGLTPLEAARGADLGAFAGLSDTERLVGNLHRAYAELDGGERGAPLELLPIAADMMTYHGGPIVAHA